MNLSSYFKKINSHITSNEERRQCEIFLDKLKLDMTNLVKNLIQIISSSNEEHSLRLLASIEFKHIIMAEWNSEGS